MPESVNSTQVQAPTCYLKAAFSNFYEYDVYHDPTRQTLKPLDPNNPTEPRWRDLPLIVENPSASNGQGLAIGVYAPEILNRALNNIPVTNARFTWGRNTVYPASDCGFLYQTGFVPQGASMIHNGYLVLGTLAEVMAGLDSLHSYFKSTGEVH